MLFPLSVSSLKLATETPIFCRDPAFRVTDLFFVVVFFFFFYKFIYLFMAALCPRCCTRAFSSCGERGLLFVAVHGLLIVVASLVVEHGL